MRTNGYMVLDAVSNFVRGRVSAPVATSDTTVSVEDASIFPDPATDGEYNVVIWDANNFPRPDQDPDVEIVRVTARDTGADELTVVRGQETTSDVAHPEGSAVHLSPTAKMFSDIEAEYTAQGENFDGQGTSEFSNLQSVSADDAGIANFAHGGGGAYICHRKGSDQIFECYNPEGELLFGGEEDVGVDDASDFGQIWEAIDDHATDRPVIHLTQRRDGARTFYNIEEPITLNNVFHLQGHGKNKTDINPNGAATENEDVVTITNPDTNDILRIDSVKHTDSGTNPSRSMYNFTGAEEILLTNCEFRDFGQYAVDLKEIDAWNYWHNNWFLTGSNIRVDDASDLVFSNNILRGVDVELTNVRGFVPSGNYIAGDVNISLDEITKAELATGVGKEGVDVQEFYLGRQGPSDEPLDLTVDLSPFRRDSVIEIELAASTSSSGAEEIKMRVDDHDGADYEQISQTGATLNDDSGTEWTLIETAGSRGAAGTWRLSSGGRPYIYGQGATRLVDQAVLTQGASEESSDLDSIRIWSEGTDGDEIDGEIVVRYIPTL